MNAIKIDNLCSSPAKKEYLKLPEIHEAKPTDRSFVEVSLQRLDGIRNGVDVVRWYGAKNGFWYPASEVFLITK